MSEVEEQFREGEALLVANAWDSEGFARGLELLRRSAAAGFVEAAVTLGDVHSQTPGLANAAGESAHWYRQAADAGHPVAQDRLADLCMLGRGLPRDDARALAWYARTAAQAYPHALCNLAYMHAEGLGTPPDARAAAELYRRALALADPCGLFNFGLRYAQSDDESLLPAAHACLALAAFANYPLAEGEFARVTARLDSAGAERARGLAADLRARLRAFQERAHSDIALAADPQALLGFAEENLGALDEPALHAAAAATAKGRPHRADPPRDVSASPRIFTVDSFVSVSECAHFMTLAEDRFTPSRKAMLEHLSGEQSAFSGEAATLLAPDSDAIVRNVERRIAAAFDLDAAHVEPLSVLRYREQDRYATHVDYFDSARLENNRRNGDRGGQRIASFLVYLRAPETGGETHYLKIGQKIAGRAGMALCHFNLGPDGKPDPLTLHTGEPVRRGEKWLARTTLREHPLF
ncbi:MAG TPA: 2OG-Fe(II) oxygenase [Gammaproteobacteria bacterium]|nr:2OG-Fe(II) oxygenase [Gammaproteobacteria bacterium]